jgi:hypothetical protein
MLELRPGELLEVLTCDPHASRDFSVWCRATGHRLVSHDERGGIHHFVIERELKTSDPRGTEVPDRLALPPAPAVFGEAELQGLPDPVQRYLRAAIGPRHPARHLGVAAHARPHQARPLGAVPCSPAARSPVRLRVGRTRRWRAHRVRPLRRRGGADVLEAARPASGRARRGPDLTRSAAGRAAAEAIWLPTTLLPRFRIRWTALDDRHLAARCDVDAVEIQAHYSIDADGRLLSMVFDRWGDPERSGTWGTASLRWRDHRLNHLRRPNDSERGAVQMVLWDRPVERRRVLPLSDHRTAPERVGTGGLPRTLAVTIGTENTTV